MSFLAPIAFWFAVTLPVVVVFYLLKRKRQVKLISSTLLWQKFLAETQANAPFQKLRNNWLMIFQLLLLALSVFALARQYFLGKAKTSELRIVILDASASMQATDVSPSRFEAARAEALKLVDALKPEERMMVLLAGGNAVVKQSPTTDKTTLRRALQDCQPTDSPTRLADALKTASAFSYEKRGESEEAVAEIHLAGHHADPVYGNALLIDSHDAPVAPAVWALYQRVIERAGPIPTLIERDDNLPDFCELLGERDQAHHVLMAAHTEEAACS